VQRGFWVSVSAQVLPKADQEKVQGARVSDLNAFQDLIRRVRAGDQQAAAELVQRYEPAIRRAVRVRLVDPRLRRVFDSADICQSVLRSFFVRLSLGEYELDDANQLVKLLITIARNKLADAAKRQRAGRRDIRRTEGLDTGDFAVDDTSASEKLAGRELLEEVRKRLSPDELDLANQRAVGRSWAEIAAERGGNGDALRMRLTRAFDRVSRELRLEE